MTTTAKFQLGQKVVDLDGLHGTIVNVTKWEDSIWYDVRFSSSAIAVRYDGDLKAA